VNNLPGFLDAQNANLFVMYAKARFEIKFEQKKSYNMMPIFYLITSCGSMFDLIQFLTLTMAHNFSPVWHRKSKYSILRPHPCLNNYSKKMVANETHVLLKY
jgi:hypothetical protein